MSALCPEIVVKCFLSDLSGLMLGWRRRTLDAGKPLIDQFVMMAAVFNGRAY